MIVAFARTLVERAADWHFDVPAPDKDRIGGKIDIDVGNSIDALSWVWNRRRNWVR